MRVTHWLLAACVAIAWLTRDARLADLHAAAGYCALFLLAFRIAWGFAGTRHARFASFLYPPRAALAYVRGAIGGKAAHFTGHNPAGSYAVFGLLAGLIAVCATGIVAIAALFAMGPLEVAFAPATADAVREIHEWLAWALLILIGLHVAGAVWGSLVHRENLVGAMISGNKMLHGAEPPVAARGAIAAAIIVALAAFVAWYLHASGWSSGYATQRPPATSALPAIWQKECGSCHTAYSPALLPLESWQRMFREQDAHFGEDLSLPDSRVRELLAAAAASRPRTWAAWKLERSAGADAPQRITELRFWKRVHGDLGEAAFKAPVSAGRHDCDACHRDAGSGIFHPRMIQKPEHGFSL